MHKQEVARKFSYSISCVMRSLSAKVNNGEYGIGNDFNTDRFIKDFDEAIDGELKFFENQNVRIN